MSVRIEGTIAVDVSDYSDELQLYADCDDIFELMEYNNITADEMIDFLKDGEHGLDEEQVCDWLEQSSINTICAISKKCIDLLRDQYNEAEEGRMAWRTRAKHLESGRNVITEASPMHN